MALDVAKKLNTSYGKHLFREWLEGETATAYLAALTQQQGFSRRATYQLEIIYNLIQDEQTQLYQRVPQEVQQGITGEDRLYVEAALVARANESAVGSQPRSGEREESPFEKWDRQERELERWARHEGCWHDDVLQDLTQLCGEEFDHGAEARVFRGTNGTTVLKALTSMFDPQETIDRIALTNFLLPETRLTLRGIGRGEDGAFTYIVEQPFIKGTVLQQESIDIAAFEDFDCDDKLSPNPYYYTDNYLLGDIHDRNVLVADGTPAVIDCNLFLNTPDRNMNGKWIIPTVQGNDSLMQSMHDTLSKLLPKTISLDEARQVLRSHPKSLKQLESHGFCNEAVALQRKDGDMMYVIFEKDPNDDTKVLWNTHDNIHQMLFINKELNDNERTLLAYGKALPKDGKTLRFSLDKGRLIENSSMSLRLSTKKENAAKQQIHH